MDSGIHDTGATSFAAGELNATAYAIPRWFLMTISGIAGVFSMTFVPWSIWVTLQLLDYQNVRDLRGDVLLDHKSRLQTLEVSRENTALQLQSISASRFTSDQANAIRDGLQSEIRAVSSEVRSLQRDFDRSFKPKGAVVDPSEIETIGEQ